MQRVCIGNLKEISNFTILKIILFILIILFGLNFTSFAQNRPSDPAARMVKFFPNPATTTISFEFQHGIDKSYSLELYNFMGKEISEFKITTQHIDISLSDFYRGVYIYQLRDKDGQILESGKFQVLK